MRHAIWIMNEPAKSGAAMVAYTVAMAPSPLLVHGL